MQLMRMNYLREFQKSFINPPVVPRSIALHAGKYVLPYPHRRSRFHLRRRRFGSKRVRRHRCQLQWYAPSIRLPRLFPPRLPIIPPLVANNASGYVFTASAVQAASNAALSHLNAGTQVGSNDYPHQYNNYEGFTFNAGCSPPYYEFPVFKSGVYTGGDPGADRIVIGTWSGSAGTAKFCDAITHYGASGNAFLQCKNT